MRRTIVLMTLAALALGQGSLAWGAVHAHRAGTSTPGKVTNATFGAAPASPTGADGRTYYNFTASPGAVLTDHVAITNLSTAPEKLEVYPVDAIPASNGTISFSPRTSPRTAAGAWMAVGTPGGHGDVTIKARSTDILPIHIKIPANAPPGDHIGAVVVSLAGVVSGQFGQGSVQKVKFNQRIAVRAAFRITGPAHPRLSISRLKASYHGPLDPFARGYAQVSYIVHNGGNIVLGGPQTVSVHGLFGEHALASNVVDVPPLLPGASYPVSVKVPRVYPEGLMTAKVSITARALQGDVNPGLKPVTSSVHFLAIPWILLIVVLLVILGLAGAYVRRRRRKHGAVTPEATATPVQGVLT